MSSRLTAEGLCLDEYSANDAYAAVHFKRAVGELPEMESAKALARLAADRIGPEQSLLDVGCGAGHYLRSYKKTIAEPFRYVGVDYYSIFLDHARKAWADEPIAEFRQGSIFDLPVTDREFDIVTSSNLLMHLPSIVKPLGELIRAARRWVLVRTMIGERSFRIQEVLSKPTWSYTDVRAEEEFDDNGEPRAFSYENIYSREYFSAVVRRYAPEASITYLDDDQFQSQNIQQSADTEGLPNATRIIDGKQVFGYVILPYCFALIELPS